LTKFTDETSQNITPSWSPDGQRIVFSSGRDGNFEIYIMNSDGSNQTRLTNNSSDDIYPIWSPDGQQIAFISNRDGNWNIYLMGIGGNNQTRLTNDPGDDGFQGLDWSPDGQQITFTSRRGDPGNTDIFVINADGSKERRLTDHPNMDTSPAWSPDGKQIAFSSPSRLDGRGWSIYVMNPDGSNQVELIGAEEGIAYDQLTWSPDGRQIAVISDRSVRDGSFPTIYLVNIDGSGEKRLADIFVRGIIDWWSPTAITLIPPVIPTPISNSAPLLVEGMTTLVEEWRQYTSGKITAISINQESGGSASETLIVALADDSKTLSVLSNEGRKWKKIWSTQLPIKPVNVLVADVDRDGTNEILVAECVKQGGQK
jgi:Tol biopolymer transport system component